MFFPHLTMHLYFPLGLARGNCLRESFFGQIELIIQIECIEFKHQQSVHVSSAYSWGTISFSVRGERLSNSVFPWANSYTDVIINCEKSVWCPSCLTHLTHVTFIMLLWRTFSFGRFGLFTLICYFYWKANALVLLLLNLMVYLSGKRVFSYLCCNISMSWSCFFLSKLRLLRLFFRKCKWCSN